MACVMEKDDSCAADVRCGVTIRSICADDHDACALSAKDVGNRFRNGKLHLVAILDNSTDFGVMQSLLNTELSPTRSGEHSLRLHVMGGTQDNAVRILENALAKRPDPNQNAMLIVPHTSKEGIA